MSKIVDSFNVNPLLMTKVAVALCRPDANPANMPAGIMS